VSKPGATAVFPTTVGRNDPCPCGSGKKFKHCCQAKEAQAGAAAWLDGRSASSADVRKRSRALLDAAQKHWAAEHWSQANTLFQEIVRLNPSNAEAHCDLGVTYVRLGRLQAATASLRRALELRPGLVRALRHLAETLEPQGREAEALFAYRKLARTAESPVERLRYSAKALVVEGKLDEADTELRRALAVAPQDAESHVLLGQLLSDRGMFEDAAPHLTLAIEALPSVFQRLTAIKRMTEADRPLVDRMRSVAERLGPDAITRINVHFGLGKAFDDLGDYAEAMRQYEAGNNLRSLSVRLDRAALAARYDSIIASFTAETLASARQPRAALEDDLPVFIVGMPRSGTTLVEQILSSHPTVAAGGELGFWAHHNGKLNALGAQADALNPAAENYLNALRHIGPEAVRVTDKAPMNFERLGILRLALPRARVIHCRRQPIDTCLSIFFTNFVGRLDYAWDQGDLAYFYRQYERLMAHWRDVLPEDRFTEVDYERLIADREAETRRLVACCGLAWDDACLAPERNQRVVKTASRWQARQPVYKTSVERWRRYEPWLGELRALLPAESQSVHPPSA
jgi:tetratricopeptide (TPR) repeat protein